MRPRKHLAVALQLTTRVRVTETLPETSKIAMAPYALAEEQFVNETPLNEMSPDGCTPVTPVVVMSAAPAPVKMPATTAPPATTAEQPRKATSVMVRSPKLIA